jgi:hypothetical protein
LGEAAGKANADAIAGVLEPLGKRHVAAEELNDRLQRIARLGPDTA